VKSLFATKTTNRSSLDSNNEQSDSLYDLPDKPLVTIEARKSWVPLNLRDLWACRELLYFLMWRDIKVRYKQTAFGSGLGGHPTACDNDHFYLLLRQAREGADGWSAVPDILLHRIVTLDFFFQRRQQWCQQPHR
jgi:hypothetical protein